MKNLLMICLFAGVVTGCSTGTLITKEGTTDNPKWHKADDVVFNKDLGTFPNLQSLSQVRQGMTKDQLYELIGRPQYDDGWRPREWNYLFHFNTPGQGENDITTCQFKVLFDQKMFANSFYWNPVHPKDAVCPPPSKPIKEPEEKVSVKRYTLGADALFVFDKRDLQGLNPKGKHDLDTLLLELKKFKEINSIRILGYTDILGSDEYNQKLSKDRAELIKEYFTYHGVNNGIITAIGKGPENPIVQCGSNLARTELIDCLAPNRRVVIEVDGFIEERLKKLD
ncbi:OmpA family protein [Acinetobacter venetianus]|uniref:Outer membrane protein A n=1 Tax=Acinetobacter venetianus TaxID=52133 RepID=A0A150HW10_9GAMM|nr:OmpA family protein [Acinetobacter venetianus]KXZ71199.1 Outer membrane protein A precursor [Acinetobacter venetianus]